MASARTALLLFLIFALVSGCASEREEGAGHSEALLFSYFTGNGEDGLHLAHSEDGLGWTALKGGASFVTPTAGRDKLMRDPSIVFGPDSLFHMVWTVSWGEKSIGYASSPDLVEWSEQRAIPVMEHEPEAQNCWAPEIVYDAPTGSYVIIWSTTVPGRFPETDNQSNEGPPAPGRNHRMYMVTTHDFVEFSETALFYDHGFNVIDGAIARSGERYVLFLKDETNRPFTPQKNIRVAFGDAATGPFGPPSEPIHGDYWAEGPTAVQIGGKWYVYFDRYRDDRFGMAVSSDFETWQDWSDSLRVPANMRHGTVFRAPQHVVEKLLALSGS